LWNCVKGINELKLKCLIISFLLFIILFTVFKL
jgi:hypothetical protein